MRETLREETEIKEEKGARSREKKIEERDIK